MNARVSYFAVVALCVTGLTAVAKAADPNPPRFNGPFHQDRNPLLRQAAVTPIAHQHVAHTHHNVSSPSYSSFDHFHGDGGYAPGYGNGYFPGYGVGTAYSSALHGEADVLRGAGEFNLLTSQAWINREEARSMNLDNQKKYVATYFEKRRIHDEAVAAEKQARVARAAAGRAKIAAVPARPVAMAVVKVNGQIQWPVGLRSEAFAAERQQLTTLLNCESNDDVRQTISTVVETMRTKLLSLLHGKQIKTMDYLAAKKFLASLEDASPENHTIDNVAQR